MLRRWRVLPGGRVLATLRKEWQAYRRAKRRGQHTLWGRSITGEAAHVQHVARLQRGRVA